MAESTPIPVRLTQDVISRLDNAAKSMGSNRNALIRFLVERWLEDYKKKGHVVLPVDWEEVMRSQDGRVARWADAAVAEPVAKYTAKPKKGKSNK